jgi:hypothetical protein
MPLQSYLQKAFRVVDTIADKTGILKKLIVYNIKFD